MPRGPTQIFRAQDRRTSGRLLQRHCLRSSARGRCSNLHTLFERGVPVTITTLSSREFNQRASEAKKAANDGLVFITDRGRPSHVLMSMEQYRRLTASQRKIADLLAMPDVADVELETPHPRELARPADLS